jgi:hypothetical protein
MADSIIADDFFIGQVLKYWQLTSATLERILQQSTAEQWLLSK